MKKKKEAKLHGARSEYELKQQLASIEEAAKEVSVFIKIVVVQVKTFTSSTYRFGEFNDGSTLFQRIIGN